MSRAQPISQPVAVAAAENERTRVPTLGEIGLDHFAPYLLNRIVARWNSDLSAQLKEHNLNTVRMRALAVLSIMSGATVNELSVYAVTEQSTMSRTLDGMAREGLIRRKQRAGDMRVREVHITEAGREAFRRFWPEMHGAFERMFAGISDREYKTLIGLLTRVLRNIRRHEI
jgi:MarR family transcriptional regulator, transcriptional regulator for hemolysin